MNNQTATYILRNDKNEVIAEFESDLPAEKLQKYLSDNGNHFCKEKFKKFVESFKIIKNKFSVLI